MVIQNKTKGIYIGLYILLYILSSLVLLPSALSQQESLGVFRKGECVNLIQTCANCTYVNFTSVINPDSTELATDLNSTKRGTYYNYSLCNLTQIGNYIVVGIGDVDGKDTVFSYNFEYNLAGRETSPTTLVAIVVGLGVICFMFFYFAFHLDDNHFILKILLIFFGLITMIPMASVFITGDYSTSSMLSNIPMWFFRIFVAYFLVYIFWHWIKTNEQILNVFRRR